MYIVAPMNMRSCVCPYFEMQYKVSLLFFLKSAPHNRDGWLLNLNPLVDVMWLLVFCVSSS